MTLDSFARYEESEFSEKSKCHTQIEAGLRV
jgi:hypothetical protein